MFKKFIEKINKEREFILVTNFIIFTIIGLFTIVKRLFCNSPELKEIITTREYVIAFMMIYLLNEWAKLQD